MKIRLIRMLFIKRFGDVLPTTSRRMSGWHILPDIDCQNDHHRHDEIADHHHDGDRTASNSRPPFASDEIFEQYPKIIAEHRRIHRVQFDLQSLSPVNRLR